MDSWRSRFETSLPVDDRLFVCYSSVDCTDIHINEKPPFDPGWMSQKFRAAAERYEVALSLASSIIRDHGPFMGGSNQDLTIFRALLKTKLLPNEVIVADAIYSDVKCLINDVVDRNVLQSIRNRHEIVFNRFKSCNNLSYRYRHDLDMHADIFSCIANLTQRSIENGAELFSIPEISQY